MKTAIKAILFGIIVSTLGLATPVSAQTVAYENPASLPDNGLQGDGTGGPYNLGLEFTVNTPIQVTALGAYDSTIGRSGTGFGSAVQVGIFSEASSTLVSPTVTFIGNINSTIVEGSQFQSISTITLEPGTYKIVASGYSIDSAKNWNVTFTSDTTSPIIFNDDGGAITLGLSYYSVDTDGIDDPDSVDGNMVLPTYGAGTFAYTVVPEPSVQGLLLLGTAVLGLGMMVRRRTSHV